MGSKDITSKPNHMKTMKTHDKPDYTTSKPNFAKDRFVPGLLAGTFGALILSAAAPAAEADASNVSDAEMTTAIDNALLFETSVPSYRIYVSTIDGITTLEGTVKDLLAKERAVLAAKATRGVRGVIDRIKVDAPGRPDPELARDVDNALAFDPAADSYEIDVKARNGKVTLTGNVDSWQERQLAVHVAKGVVGVNEVVDDMTHLYDTDRSDTELANEIERAIEIDVILRPLLISTKVSDGNVTLTGTVGSVAEKDRALARAYVMGVKTVDASGLEVEAWASADMKKKRIPAMRSDEEIKKAVVDTMLYDPRVASFKPTVSVNVGYVTLTGNVDNLKAKEAAGHDARNTAGVRGVDNLLKVRTGEEMDDTKIAAKLDAALTWNTVTESYEIEAEVEDGVATLTGTVDSYLERLEAEDVANRTTGVLDVKNKLKVDLPEMTYFSHSFDPNWVFPPYHTYNREGERTWPAVSDARIIENIEDEFFWSPFVDEENITITAKYGDVTLTGTVDDYSEFRDATENAYEGGAAAVINKLEIE